MTVLSLLGASCGGLAAGDAERVAVSNGDVVPIPAALVGLIPEKAAPVDKSEAPEPEDEDCPEVSYVRLAEDCGDEPDSGSSSGVGGNYKSVFALQVGECGQLPDTATIRSIEVVDCDVAHDFEVVDEFTVSYETYPGEEVVFDEAAVDCVSSLEGYADTDYVTSDYDVFILYPTAQSWVGGDRTVTCLGISFDGDKIEGTMENTGR